MYLNFVFPDVTCPKQVTIEFEISKQYHSKPFKKSDGISSVAFKFLVKQLIFADFLVDLSKQAVATNVTHSVDMNEYGGEEVGIVTVDFISRYGGKLALVPVNEYVVELRPFFIGKLIDEGID